MKPSVIIALLVGGVIGFAVGNMASRPSEGGSPSAAAPAVPGAPAPRPPGGAPAGDATVYKVSLDDAPVRGPATALVTIVEFSDYQCPFCSRAHNTMVELEKQYGGKIRVAMKQHPLDFHPRAKPASLAALSAGAQGKYWEMHDKIFANQQQLEDATFEGYAKELGLNVDKWKADQQSPSFAAQISKDTAQAMQLGATGTPAFFINGRKVSGAQPIDNFKRVIDEELAKAQELVKNGTPADQVYAKVIANGATAPAPAPQAPSAPSAPAPAAIRKVDVPADSPARGAKTPKVTIVAWSDFQCPFCSRVVPTLHDLEKQYAGKLKIIFKHQPLPFHNNAKIAAAASMAANEQGKFWEMHDKMFANQQKLTRADLEGFATEIGLNMAKFKDALDKGTYAQQVKDEAAEGQKFGVQGTPSWFVNGVFQSGALPPDAIKAKIAEFMDKPAP